MNEAQISFLRDSLMHHRDIKNALDQKASIILALSGVIFGLSIGRLDKPQFLFLAICSFISALLAVLIVRLPFRGIKKEDSNLICWWYFDKNFEQYKNELKEIFSSDEKIADEYKKEIWSLANYSIKPKSKILKWATWILVVGLLGGFILFFI